MRKVTVYKAEIPGDGFWIVKLIIAAGFTETCKEARQLISRNLIKLNGEVVKSDIYLSLEEGEILLEYLDNESVLVNVSD